MVAGIYDDDDDGCREFTLFFLSFSLSQPTGTITYQAQAQAPRKVVRHQTRCQSHAPHCQPARGIRVLEESKANSPMVHFIRK